MKISEISFYPWNYWILYGSIVLLVIFIIMTAMKALGLLQELKTLNDKTAGMQRNLKLMQIKTEAINEKSAEQKKKNKLFMTAIPILLAVQKAYKDNDSFEGAKGYVSAAKKVYEDRQSEKSFIAKIKKSL